MAINLNTQYPGQTAGVNNNYPFGQGRNVTTQNDNTGTPFEMNWFNDVYGFLQGLLSDANATPTGTPDNVVNSQYRDALESLFLQGTFGQAAGNIPVIGNPQVSGQSELIVNKLTNANGTAIIFNNDSFICYGLSLGTGSTNPRRVTLPVTVPHVNYFINCFVIGGVVSANPGLIINGNPPARRSTSFDYWAGVAQGINVFWIVVG